jgi:GT2 family glycosyltransferase
LSAARIVRGEGDGPAAARNRGVRAARGDVVCFIDDDCVADPRWAERLAHACREVGAAAGRTVADPAAGKSAAAAQLLTHVLQVTSLDPGRGALAFAPSCNIACSAQLARVLPFDESFPLAAGEDRDWCARLAQTGAALRFVPDATVTHRPQLGVRGLLDQQRRYGRGAVRFRTAGGGRRLAGLDFYARVAREAAGAGAPVAALVALAQGAVTAGAVSELVATRFKRQQR